MGRPGQSSVAYLHLPCSKILSGDTSQRRRELIHVLIGTDTPVHLGDDSLAGGGGWSAGWQIEPLSDRIQSRRVD